MRCCLALVLFSLGCGGRAASTSPQDRGPVHLVRCQMAPSVPLLGPENAAYGLLGTVSGEMLGVLRGSAVGELDGGFGSGGGGAGIAIGIGTIGARTGSPAGADAGSGAEAEAPAPYRVAMSEPHVIGSLAPAVVAGVLQQRAPELDVCAAKHGASLKSGRAPSSTEGSWRLTIGPTGGVIHAGAFPSGFADEISACVTGALRGAVFPAPPDKRAVAVAVSIAFDGPGARRDALPEEQGYSIWTPFALEYPGPEDDERVVRAVEGALRTRLGAIGACFTNAPVSGSFRAMLELDYLGGVTGARVGGLGDNALEACIENAVTGLRAAAGSDVAAELACDLSRGDAQPWRVTVARSGYHVVTVDRERVRHGDQMLAAIEDPDALSEPGTYVIVVDPDAPGSLISRALASTRDAAAAIVALRPAAAPAGAPPQFLAMGYVSANGSPDDGDFHHQPTLELGATTVSACMRKLKEEAKLSDPAAVSAAVRKLLDRCSTQRCTPSLVIALGKDSRARDIAELTGIVRRAGLERVLLAPARDATTDATSAAGCTPPAPSDDDHD